MASYILKKWMEPYVLLETLKKHYEITDFTFDGWTKLEVKGNFFKALNKPNTLGLYMKNVNKFYLFSGVNSLDIMNLFSFSEDELLQNDDAEASINLVDLGKAEAAFIKF